MNTTDPFHILGLQPGAARDEVRRAYRKLAMRWHPDRNQHSKTSEERFKHIKAAYEIASDEAAYLNWRANRASAQTSHHSARSSHAHAQPKPPPPEAQPESVPPVEQTLQLTLEEVARGGRKTIRVERSEPCAPCEGVGRVDHPHSLPCPQCMGIGRLRGKTPGFMGSEKCPECDGRGYVRHISCKHCGGQGAAVGEAIFEVLIPVGLRDGETLRLARTDGSVLLHIAYLPHAFFKVQNDDLHCIVPVNVLAIIAGGEVEVPTLDGSLRVPLPGDPFGAEIRLAKKGLPQRKGRHAGDLVLHFRPIFPKNLSAAELTHLRALAASLNKNMASRMPELDDWHRQMAQRERS